MEFDIVTITSKGQIVIPKNIRASLELKKGERLLAYNVGDSIALKRLKGAGENKSSLEDVFQPLWKRAQERGITEADVKDEIGAHRQNAQDSP